MALDRLISSLDGVGPARAEAFAAIGVRTLGGLLEYFPRDYRTESAERPIGNLVLGDIQTARGEVVAVDYIPTRPRPRFEATLDDGTGKLALTFFNAAYLRQKIHPGLHLRVKGAVRFFRCLPQMTNPKWEAVEPGAPAADGKGDRFVAVYPATERLSSDTIGRVIGQHIDHLIEHVDEWFEPELLDRRQLPSRRQAYRDIHCPRDDAAARAARRRLVYDELMLMQVGLGLSKRAKTNRLSAPVFRLDKLLDERIRGRFPFQLTLAQQNAVWEICRDLQSGQPMNRLLQGDVGSGKTAVAIYAMLAGVANKMQSALLAPTEVLAEQHYLNLSNALANTGVRVGLYTGRSKRAATAAKAELASGRVHLAVGTQALIQPDVEFANLGLVIVDEQHKLGVRQRAVLKDKGLHPHYLVMTATPIPRTLALSYFADFDLSVIDSLPPGRQPIETKWVKPAKAAGAYDFVRSQVSRGRQAYVVVPQIEDSGPDDAKSAIKEFDRLSQGPLKGLRLGLLHGQLPAEEKQGVMSRFRAGDVNVLVATTVIEVGVDVPNATVMVIEDAGRFGLSQLHQLRGRVGRGSAASFCLLISDATSDAAKTRLNAMCQTNDGFAIAETDLKLRGPGQFFGTRQHGLPELKLADITAELDLLAAAREDAGQMLADDPGLRSPAHRALRAAVTKQFGGALQLAQVG